MPHNPVFDGNDGFSVSPDRLVNTAPLFYKASQDTFDLEVSLNTQAQELIDHMSTILNQSPAALQTFFNRWRSAMLSLSDSLQSVGDNLSAAGNGYSQSDTDVSNTFQGSQAQGFDHGHVQ